jgi:hypothetical protein
VARLTAASRRKLNALTSKVSALEAALTQGDVSAKEVDRRRDMVARLRTHVAQLSELLARKDAPQGRRCARLRRGLHKLSCGSHTRGGGRRRANFRWRHACLRSADDAGGAGAADERPRETLETAERDELGLLVLQRELLAKQDEELEELSRVVTSTRRIALAVNEELGLQSRLLARRPAAAACVCAGGVDRGGRRAGDTRADSRACHAVLVVGAPYAFAHALSSGRMTSKTT